MPWEFVSFLFSIYQRNIYINLTRCVYWDVYNDQIHYINTIKLGSNNISVKVVVLFSAVMIEGDSLDIASADNRNISRFSVTTIQL